MSEEFTDARVALLESKLRAEGRNKREARRFELAKAAMQGLIVKLPLIDFEGQFGVKLAAQECDKFKRDVVISAIGYADEMLAALEDKHNG
jgi:hypothetical protein